MPGKGFTASRTGAFGRLLLFWALFFPLAAPADPCAVPASAPVVEVRRVIDGDTLQLADGRRVRIIGLDAPELGRDGAADQAFAREAANHLRTLVAMADGRVRLQVGEQATDRYGRTLARIFSDRHGDLAAHVLANGLALQAAVPPDLGGLPCHRAAERTARDAGLGLWSGPVVIPSASLDRTGFAILRGRSGQWDVRRRDRLLELEGGVVLRIRDDDHARWFAGVPLDGWENAQLEVRGWVHPWGDGGRAITLQHPASVEVIGR